MDELLSQARDGDQDAFASLVAPHRDELTAHCYRMLGSLADAEDTVQESLTRAWRGLGSYRDRGNLRAWLYKIATNRCLTLLKSRSRRELPGLSDESSTDIAWLGPYPDHRLAYAEQLDPQARTITRESTRIAFVAALQRLPPRQRAVLLLRDVLDYSAAETAQLLDTSVPSVNSALQRARKARPARPAGDAPHEVLEVAGRYAAAWEAGDVPSIVAMLTADARYSMPPIPTVYTGHVDIERFLREGPMAHRWRFVPTRANDTPAFGTYLWDGSVTAYVPAGLDLITVEQDRITEVVSFLDADFGAFGLPEKLPPKQR